MERILIESSIRALLIACATGLALRAFRIQAPALRHAAWTGVVIASLILPLWTAWGPHAPMRLLPAVPTSTMAPLTVSSVPLLEETQAAALPAVSVKPAWTIEQALIALYLCGAAVLLFRLMAGTLRTRRLVRTAVWKDGHLTSAACASPITVGYLSPVVVLPAYWKAWSSDQLDAVLTHEREHVRRRDSLVQWLALLNRAVFWFHPLAWWLERKLSGLAEEACDAAVLRRGHDPHSYSEYLLDIARSVMNAGTRVEVIGMTMPGSLLPERIQSLFAGVSFVRPSRLRVVSMAVVCMALSTTFAAATLERRVEVVRVEPLAVFLNPAPAEKQSAVSEEPVKVSISGEVQKPGIYQIRPGKKITLMQALALSGGFTSSASNAVLIGREQTGEKIAVDVNLILYGQAADPELQSQDLVHVPARRRVEGAVLPVAFAAQQTEQTGRPFSVEASIRPVRPTSAAFEVATIRPVQVPAGVRGGCHGVNSKNEYPLGRCIITSGRMDHMVAIAFGAGGMASLRIGVQIPWIEERFDVEGKAEFPEKATEADLMAMLQNFLIDRFQLKMHREIITADGFELIVGPNGPRFTAGSGGAPPSDQTRRPNETAEMRRAEDEKMAAARGAIAITMPGTTMDQLAARLSQTGKTVLNKTGLTGTYDIRLQWDELMGPALTTAVQEQLGLKLVATKVPRDLLVIDSAEKPRY